MPAEDIAQLLREFEKADGKKEADQRTEHQANVQNVVAALDQLGEELDAKNEQAREMRAELLKIVDKAVQEELDYLKNRETIPAGEGGTLVDVVIDHALDIAGVSGKQREAFARNDELRGLTANKLHAAILGKMTGPEGGDDAYAAKLKEALDSLER